MDNNFFTRPVRYDEMRAYIDELAGRYPFIGVEEIGSSLLGRAIPMLRVGRGKRRCMYVGCHHAMEWHTALLLLRFAADIGEWYECDRFRYGLDPRFVLGGREICIIPMLNPDGAELVCGGFDESCVLAERLLAMNGGSQDFSHWQANARGVDLNHNYNAGFAEYKKLEPGLGISGPGATRYAGEFPESEPETKALCSFLRAAGGAYLLMALHTQGEEIYYDYNGWAPGAQAQTARVLARCSGYTLARPEPAASYSGLKDWFLCEFGPLAFTVECGRGTNPLPPRDTPYIYARLRKMLFRSLVL